MDKFKVGDYVRIKDSARHDDYFGGWNERMLKHKGKTGKITSVSHNSFCEYAGYYIEGIHWVWDERMLELSYPNIVIWNDGNKVYAKNPKTGETAFAACSPADTFDYAVGAKLAIERLLGTEKKPEEKKPLNCKFIPLQSDKFLKANHVYEVINGSFKCPCDDGYVGHFPIMYQLTSFEHLQDYLHNKISWHIYGDKPIDIIQVYDS